MIFNLFRKPAVAPDAVDEAYRSIVAQSRQVTFYADWGVPDTVTGRFDMVSLHLALFLHRMKGVPEAKPFTQALTDLFFLDMDRSVRELGVTDLGVAKKVRKMAEVFYGLVRALDPALDSGNARRTRIPARPQHLRRTEHRRRPARGLPHRGNAAPRGSTGQRIDAPKGVAA